MFNFFLFTLMCTSTAEKQEPFYFYTKRSPPKHLEILVQEHKITEKQFNKNFTGRTWKRTDSLMFDAGSTIMGQDTAFRTQSSGEMLNSHYHGIPANMSVILTNPKGSSPSTRSKDIYIGGLLDMVGDRGLRYGLSELTAAKVAVSHINNRQKLNGYTLRLLHNDSKVDSQGRCRIITKRVLRLMKRGVIRAWLKQKQKELNARMELSNSSWKENEKNNVT